MSEPTYEQLRVAVIQLVRCVGRTTENGLEVRLDDAVASGGWPDATLEMESLGPSRFAEGNVILWRARAVVAGRPRPEHEENGHE